MNARPKLRHHRINYRPTVELWATIERYAAELKLSGPTELINTAVAHYCDLIRERRGEAAEGGLHVQEIRQYVERKSKSEPRRRRQGAKTTPVEHPEVFHDEELVHPARRRGFGRVGGR